MKRYQENLVFLKYILVYIYKLLWNFITDRTRVNLSEKLATVQENPNCLKFLESLSGLIAQFLSFLKSQSVNDILILFNQNTNV